MADRQLFLEGVPVIHARSSLPKAVPSFHSFLSRGCASCSVSLITNMHFTHFAAVTLGLSGILEAAATPHHAHPVKRQNRGGNGNGNGGGNNGNLCLNQDLVQSASDLSGQESGSEGIAAGQSPSAQ
jgi:hypothetical protein